MYDYWTYENLFSVLCKFYVFLMVLISILYMVTMYKQYKNAHDKWYDINNETKYKYNLSPRLNKN